MHRWIFLIIALTFATASAQDVPGLPADWQPLATLAIGLLSAVLVGPLTAIAKKLGRTSGPTTVAISAAMSLLVALGFSLWQAAATESGVPWGQALLLALIAFIKSNGDYISRVFATAKGQGAPKINFTLPAPQPAPGGLPVGVGSEVVPPFDLNSPPSGLEPIPGLDGPAAPLGLFGGLTDAVVERGIEAVITELLTQAGMQATPQQLVRVAARLAVVAPDLMDGGAYLSADNRNRVLNVILDLKAGGAL